MVSTNRFLFKRKDDFPPTTALSIKPKRSVSEFTSTCHVVLVSVIYVDIFPYIYIHEYLYACHQRDDYIYANHQRDDLVRGVIARWGLETLVVIGELL